MNPATGHAGQGREEKEDEMLMYEPIDRGAALRTTTNIVAAAAAAAAAAAGDDIDAHDYENVDTVASSQRPNTTRPIRTLDTHSMYWGDVKPGRGDDHESPAPAKAVAMHVGDAQSQDDGYLNVHVAGAGNRMASPAARSGNSKPGGDRFSRRQATLGSDDRTSSASHRHHNWVPPRGPKPAGVRSPRSTEA